MFVFHFDVYVSILDPKRTSYSKDLFMALENFPIIDNVHGMDVRSNNTISPQVLKSGYA